MAERAGFEPAVGVAYTRFPSVLLKPLGHLSQNRTLKSCAERQGFEPRVPFRSTTVFKTAPISRSGTSPKIVLLNPARRGRDSNPGYPHGHNGFRDRPDQPLRHLSILFAGLPVSCPSRPVLTNLCKKFLQQLTARFCKYAADHLGADVEFFAVGQLQRAPAGAISWIFSPINNQRYPGQ